MLGRFNFTHHMSTIAQKRHTLAHLMAAAIKNLYPHANITLGPAIEHGFYYDIDFKDGPSPKDSDLKKIEDTMCSILPSWTDVTERTLTKDEALALFDGNPYKIELIDEIVARGESVTVYTSGTGEGAFTDLCRGDHAENPSHDIAPDSFMLEKLAGAYWRGDEKNTMLTRIYGLAFDTKEELDLYLVNIEEARKRDHKKLGPELGIFTISPLVGAGLPLLKPAGAIIRREIEEYLWDLHKNKGYERVWTPHITKKDLYEISGHASKFGDELFRVKGKDEEFIMKPMNCPHHMQIFADDQFSYRDMPVRYFEPATVYRDEKTGQLGGLTRVRSITQDDGHLFCRVGQITDEVSTIVGIIREFYTTMGLLEGYWVRLSVRGEDGLYIGEDAVWEKAESALENAAQQNKLNYRRVEGEAAFYGPKLDFMFKDAIGREWQLATIQCDFNLPERFDLSYINENGEKERPVVIHRAISGSLERFIGVMIEHFAGNFPLWLSPEQVRVIPVGELQKDYAESLHKKLSFAGIRAKLDDSNESLGKKIRNAKVAKAPYYVVVGQKEIESGTLTLESRSGIKTTTSIDEMSVILREEITSRTLPK